MCIEQRAQSSRGFTQELHPTFLQTGLSAGHSLRPPSPWLFLHSMQPPSLPSSEAKPTAAEDASWFASMKSWVSWPIRSVLKPLLSSMVDEIAAEFERTLDEEAEAVQF